MPEMLGLERLERLETIEFRSKTQLPTLSLYPLVSP